VLLGNHSKQIKRAFRSGDEISSFSDNQSLEQYLSYERPDFLISFGYREKIPVSLLKRIGIASINLHTSLLPFNKGAHPLLWSVLEDTPTGVSIHLMREEIDDGEILVQNRMYLSDKETFATAYSALQTNMANLFLDHWNQIRVGELASIPQTTMGTRHLKRHFAAVRNFLENGWHTNIKSARHKYSNYLASTNAPDVTCVHQTIAGPWKAIN
jgi:methionyl-tRNA formyltransferase